MVWSTGWLVGKWVGWLVSQQWISGLVSSWSLGQLARLMGQWVDLSMGQLGIHSELVCEPSSGGVSDLVEWLVLQLHG